MFERGDRIFLPGSSGEPVALSRAVLGAQGVDITTSFVPGVNAITNSDIGPDTSVTGLFMHAGLAEAQRSGQYRHLPQSYAAMTNWLRQKEPFDCCVVQVAPPDAEGNCSLGPAVEFTSQVLRRVRRIVAVVNPNVPQVPGGVGIPYSSIATTIESDAPLIAYEVGEVDPATLSIARTVVDYIPDGAVLQTGLGKVPHAIMAALHDRRGLRLHSGMLSDGVIGLAASGALDNVWPHRTTVVLGTVELYGWLEQRSDIHVESVEITHNPAMLAGIEKFFAINSALEVDLFGQCNIELAGGKAVSGSGGATDFTRAGRLSPGGLSIVALPATFGGDERSRIRAWLGEGSMTSLARSDVDVIVTEHGAADLRGLSVHERAEAIIAIAAPAAISDLLDQWHAIAARL